MLPLSPFPGHIEPGQKTRHVVEHVATFEQLAHVEPLVALTGPVVEIVAAPVVPLGDLGASGPWI
jgi:hypothetical protein